MASPGKLGIQFAASSRELNTTDIYSYDVPDASWESANIHDNAQWSCEQDLNGTRERTRQVIHHSRRDSLHSPQARPTDTCQSPASGEWQSLVLTDSHRLVLVARLLFRCSGPSSLTRRLPVCDDLTDAEDDDVFTPSTLIHSKGPYVVYEDGSCAVPRTNPFLVFL